jgi:hypothetical protein
MYVGQEGFLPDKRDSRKRDQMMGGLKIDLAIMPFMSYSSVTITVPTIFG